MTLRGLLATTVRSSAQNNRLQIQRATFASWSVHSETGIVSSKDKDAPTFQTIIGLEIHAQLNIPDKLFSSAPRPNTSFPRPNSYIDPFDLGVPGFLPQVSQSAVQAAVLSAAAVRCKIPPRSRFERKHYFYADLPLGYQVTQQRWPIAKEGLLVCHPHHQTSKKKKAKPFPARIERIQLEQDTGKTIVMPSGIGTTSMDSWVDFNRAGSALIEIVFYPDIRSSLQAATAVETLRSLLRHIGTCDGKMEEGSLRCDLNVSIAPIPKESDPNKLKDLADQTPAWLQYTGNRVEVKNLNSLRQVQQAAEYEAIRQTKAYLNGEPTGQETRTFDVKSGKTVVIRTKEGAKDYRFMPEPDLPPIVLDNEVFGGMDIDQFLDTTLPELPEDARQRLRKDYGLSEYMANVLTGDPPAIQMFDEAVQAAYDQLGDSTVKGVPGNVSNLLSNELFALVREHEMVKAHEESESGEASVKFSAVNGVQLGHVAALLANGTISSTMAKQLIRILYTEEVGRDVLVVAKERGFELISDAEQLAVVCRQVIEENPPELEKYLLGGKFARKIEKFFLGKAMQKTSGNAHPERLREVMEEVLDEIAPDVERE
eukprot:Nitzschia sp. Nitz4//scaffold25_size161228//24232//26108//NITZ4_002416-RA/size161228-processed-gene-0.155-mRNA-1//1//CDS//3329544544//5388//frame0